MANYCHLEISRKALRKESYLSEALEVVGSVYEELMNRDHSGLRNSRAWKRAIIGHLQRRVTKYIFLEQKVGKVGNKNRKIGWDQIVKDLESQVRVFGFVFKIRVLKRHK